ncbi:MAG: hypothetical protein AMS17_18300 [Spirochaetes bacterium DG_61]|jgi:hypothetical protein|nr:MAG: hypothetical protein AMS17_18300 [Spirochaetes bacterium DG_61]
MMVTGVSEKVTIGDFHPHVEPETQAANSVKTDEIGNPVIVTKDFILNLLSLAIGKPGFLEGNLGNKVDVKV